MAGMRLDIRDEALKPTAVGRDADRARRSGQERDHRSASSPSGARVMPPAFAHKELTAAQKDTIRHWVAEGAEYEGHWAYQPVQRPAVPTRPIRRARNPIDAFIQAAPGAAKA